MLTAAVAPVLGVSDVAELLQCTEQTVRDRAPSLCGLKYGRDWVFPTAAFLEALNSEARDTMSRATQSRTGAGRICNP